MRLQLGLCTFCRRDSHSGPLQYFFACGLCHGSFATSYLTLARVASPILFWFSSCSSNMQDDFEAAARHFNLEGQPQFAAHTSMLVSGVAYPQPGQN